MLGAGSGEVHQLAIADRFLAEGVGFARARDLDRLADYMEAWQALVNMYRGRWEIAGEQALQYLHCQASPDRLMALVALGRLRTRRGDPGADEALDLALALADQSGTPRTGRTGALRARRKCMARWRPGARAPRSAGGIRTGERTRPPVACRRTRLLAVAQRRPGTRAGRVRRTVRAADRRTLARSRGRLGKNRLSVRTGARTGRRRRSGATRSAGDFRSSRRQPDGRPVAPADARGRRMRAVPRGPRASTREQQRRPRPRAKCRCWLWSRTAGRTRASPRACHVRRAPSSIIWLASCRSSTPVHATRPSPARVHAASFRNLRSGRSAHARLPEAITAQQAAELET